MKLQDLFIGLIMVGLIVGGFMSFFIAANDKYPNPTYEDTGTLAAYQQQVLETQNLTTEVQDKMTNLKPTSSALDILNAYFGGAYTAVINGVKSYAIFSSIAQIGFADLGIPKEIIFGLLAIVLILVVFILVRMVTKQE